MQTKFSLYNTLQDSSCGVFTLSALMDLRQQLPHVESPFRYFTPALLDRHPIPLLASLIQPRLSGLIVIHLVGEESAIRQLQERFYYWWSSYLSPPDKAGGDREADLFLLFRSPLADLDAIDVAMYNKCYARQVKHVVEFLFCLGVADRVQVVMEGQSYLTVLSCMNHAD